MHKKWLVGLAALVLVGSAAAQTGTKPSGDRPAAEPAITEPPVARSLERFESEQEFLRYVRDVQRLSQTRRRAEVSDDITVTGTTLPPMPPPPPPPPPPAPAAAMADSAGALGAAPVAQQQASSEPTSITNVQTQGVDEGGIVKMVGRFLVILQDGRLFVTDTRPGGAPGLALTGRTNVYRSPRNGA